MAGNWTTLADVRRQVQRAWDRGDHLRELLVPTDAYPRRRALKHPSAVQLRDSYGAARTWAAEFFAGAPGLTVETVPVGHRTIGSNEVPAAARFATVHDEIGFLGKTRQAGRFLELAGELTALDAGLGSWCVTRPLKLLDLGGASVTAALVALWIRDNPRSGIHVRQLSLPAVHSKFVETHRKVIDDMVAVLVGGAVDAAPDEPETRPSAEGLLAAGSRSPATRFAHRHGFLWAPELVRFRMLDSGIPLLGAARDITVTADGFSTLELPVHTVIVTENLVNFLSLPDRPGSMALFGKGYGFTALRDAAWLARCRVLYWGDLDTHGFRILDQLRAYHPHVESVLMDAATLSAHRPFWGSESTSTRAALTRLTPAEAELYGDLGDDTFGPAVRLEQEHIGWDWAVERLDAALGS